MLIPQILTNPKRCKTQLSQMKMQPFPHLCCPTSFFFSWMHLTLPCIQMHRSAFWLSVAASLVVQFRFNWSLLQQDVTALKLQLQMLNGSDELLMMITQLLFSCCESLFKFSQPPHETQEMGHATVFSNSIRAAVCFLVVYCHCIVNFIFRGSQLLNLSGSGSSLVRKTCLQSIINQSNSEHQQKINRLCFSLSFFNYFNDDYSPN